jgi:hypothetical protein
LGAEIVRRLTPAPACPQGRAQFAPKHDRGDLKGPFSASLRPRGS